MDDPALKNPQRRAFYQGLLAQAHAEGFSLLQYYFNPAGQRFRSRQEIVRHLEAAAQQSKKVPRQEAAAHAQTTAQQLNKQLPLSLDNGVKVVRYIDVEQQRELLGVACLLHSVALAFQLFGTTSLLPVRLPVALNTSYTELYCWRGCQLKVYIKHGDACFL